MLIVNELASLALFNVAFWWMYGYHKIPFLHALGIAVLILLGAKL